MPAANGEVLRGGEVLDLGVARVSPKKGRARGRKKKVDKVEKHRATARSTVKKVIDSMAKSSDWLPLLLLFAFGGGARAPGGRQPKGLKAVTQWAPLVKSLTAGTNVPAGVVLGIIEHESGGLATADHLNDNGTHDFGLMQLNNGGTMQDLGVQSKAQAFDPTTNVRAGVRLLSELISEWGRIDLALAAYAEGSGAVKKAGNRVPAGAQSFVTFVLTAARGVFAGV